MPGAPPMTATSPKLPLCAACGAAQRARGARPASQARGALGAGARRPGRRTRPAPAASRPAPVNRPGLSVSRRQRVRARRTQSAPSGWPVSASRPDGRSTASTRRSAGVACAASQRRSRPRAARDGADAEQGVDGQVGQRRRRAARRTRTPAARARCQRRARHRPAARLRRRPGDDRRACPRCCRCTRRLEAVAAVVAGAAGDPDACARAARRPAPAAPPPGRRAASGCAAAAPRRRACSMRARGRDVVQRPGPVER